MSDENENTDPYAEYDEEDRKGMEAQGAAKVLEAIQRAVGEREMANLQEKIANTPAATFKDEKEWTADDWSDAFTSGRKSFAELPEKVQRRIEG